MAPPIENKEGAGARANLAAYLSDEVANLTKAVAARKSTKEEQMTRALRLVTRSGDLLAEAVRILYEDRPGTDA